MDRVTASDNSVTHRHRTTFSSSFAETRHVKRRSEETRVAPCGRALMKAQERGRKPATLQSWPLAYDAHRANHRHGRRRQPLADDRRAAMDETKHNVDPEHKKPATTGASAGARHAQNHRQDRGNSMETRSTPQRGRSREDHTTERTREDRLRESPRPSVQRRRGGHRQSQAEEPAVGREEQELDDHRRARRERADHDHAPCRGQLHRQQVDLHARRPQAEPLDIRQRRRAGRHLRRRRTGAGSRGRGAGVHGQPEPEPHE